MLRRDDERGVVVIRRRPAVAGSLDAVARRARAQPAHAASPTSGPPARASPRCAARTGLVYTFVRPRADQVQSIVVAPAGDHAYTLDLVADGDAPDVARELGRMVTSFTPAS